MLVRIRLQHPEYHNKIELIVSLLDADPFDENGDTTADTYILEDDSSRTGNLVWVRDNDGKIVGLPSEYITSINTFDI